MEHDPQPEAYCVHAWIRGIHPMLWRRFLVRSDSTLADLHDLWQPQVRIEKRLEIEPSRSYPVCVGGQWAGPPEDCGGPQAFLDRRASAPWRVRELLDDLLEDIKARDTDALDYRLEELQLWQEWLMLHRFDRRRVNRRLRQYAEGAPQSMNSRGGWQR